VGQELEETFSYLPAFEPAATPTVTDSVHPAVAENSAQYFPLTTNPYAKSSYGTTYTPSYESMKDLLLPKDTILTTTHLCTT
jgi:hypothetical protein